MNQIVIVVIILTILAGLSIGGYFIFSPILAHKTPTPAQIPVQTSITLTPTPLPVTPTQIPTTPPVTPTPVPTATPIPVPTPPPNPFASISNGQAITCLNNKPDGIFRYTGNNTINWYPNPEIAGSWDSMWSKPTTVDCSSATVGTPMEKKVLTIEDVSVGQSLVCRNSKPDGVYRYTGNKTINWYPNPEIAVSWNPFWSSSIKTIDCSSATIGAPMAKKIYKLSELAVGQSVMCLDNKPPGVYRYTGNNTINWYPTPEIAGSWDPTWGSPKTIECAGVTVGPQMVKKA